MFQQAEMWAILGKGLIEQLRKYAASENDSDKAQTLRASADLIERLRDGRSTPVEPFPKDGLHPETERVIREHLKQKELEYEK